MPITLNVGLSRKVSQDYNSRGYSINLNVELPVDAVNDPSTITQSADQLFGLCDHLLDQQIKGDGGSNSTEPTSRGNGRSKPNGRTYRRNGNGQSNGARSLTNAQERAITNMARRIEQDADDWARQEFDADVSQLTVKQASQLIDQLKQEIEAAGAGSGGR